MVKLHLDVSASEFAMRLACAAQPFVSAEHAQISGTAAIGRQTTAPPQTMQVSVCGWGVGCACQLSTLCPSVNGRDFEPFEGRTRPLL